MNVNEVSQSFKMEMEMEMYYIRPKLGLEISVKNEVGFKICVFDLLIFFYLEKNYQILRNYAPTSY